MGKRTEALENEGKTPDDRSMPIPVWYQAIAVALFIGGFTAPLVPVFAIWGYYEGRRRGFQADRSVDGPADNFARRVVL